MDKQSVLHLHKGILFCNINEQTSEGRDNMDKSQMHSVSWRKLDSKTKYCIIPLLQRYRKVKNFRDRNPISGCQKLEVETEDGSQRDMRELLKWEKVLYLDFMAVVMWC